jgi:hypothetical protein
METPSELATVENGLVVLPEMPNTTPIAAGTIRVAKEDTKTNLADFFTKLLDGVTLRFLMLGLLW